MHHRIKNDFALNEADLSVRLFVGKEQLRSPQDDEALTGCLPWKMDINAHPDSGSLGAVSVPWIMGAKDPWLKILNSSSQKISKGLCNMLLKCSMESSRKKASQPLLSGWKQMRAFDIGSGGWGRHYCPKLPLSSKDGALVNTAEPTFLPCEGRVPKREPCDSVKGGSSEWRGV